MYLGIGYKGDDYNCKTDKQIVSRWHGILTRCYNSKSQDYKDYGAKGITVSEDWFNFSNFKKWWLENYWECDSEWLTVDKDILSGENKIYSAETCLFIPFSINSLLSRFGKESKNKNVKINAGGIDQLENGLYRLNLFGTSFSTFTSLDNALNTQKQVYTALFDGLLNNYPNMPLKVKNAILDYAFKS